MSPYKNKSVNMPTATVERMKRVLERASNAQGRFDDEDDIEAVDAIDAMTGDF